MSLLTHTRCFKMNYLKTYWLNTTPLVKFSLWSKVQYSTEKVGDFIAPTAVCRYSLQNIIAKINLWYAQCSVVIHNSIHILNEKVNKKDQCSKMRTVFLKCVQSFIIIRSNWIVLSVRKSLIKHMNQKHCMGAADKDQ